VSRSESVVSEKIRFLQVISRSRLPLRVLLTLLIFHRLQVIPEVVLTAKWRHRPNLTSSISVFVTLATLTVLIYWVIDWICGRRSYWFDCAMHAPEVKKLRKSYDDSITFTHVGDEKFDALWSEWWLQWLYIVCVNFGCTIVSGMSLATYRKWPFPKF
jgi:hypothetical protein